MSGRLLPSLLALGVLVGCVETTGGVDPHIGTTARTGAQATSLSELEAEFAALAPAGERLTLRREYRDFEVIAQIDMSSGAVVYRIIVADPSISSADLRDAPSMFEAPLRAGGRIGSLVAASFPKTPNSAGLHVSPWTACDRCWSYWPVRQEIAPRHRRYQQVMLTAMKRAAQGRGAGDVRLGEGAWFRDNWGFAKAGFVASGREAAERQAAETAAALGVFKEKREGSKEAETAYFAYRREIEPLTLFAHIQKQGCEETYRSRTAGGPDQWRELMRQNERFIDCRLRALETYDHAEFARRLPELSAKEKELAKAAYGLKRPPLYTAEGQVQQVIRAMNGAQEGIEQGEYALGYFAEQRAQRERKRQRMQTMMLETQRVINAAQAAVRDMAPVVRRDGTISSVGQERARAEAAARLAAAQASAGGGSKPSGKKASGASSSRSSGKPSRKASGGSGGGSNAASGGSRELYMVRGVGRVEEQRCLPMNAMRPGRYARCRLMQKVEHYALHSAECTVYSDGKQRPAEVFDKIVTHQVVNVSGLNNDEFDRLYAQLEAAKAPFAVGMTMHQAVRAAQEQQEKLGRPTNGLRNYWRSLDRLKEALRSVGCAAYEIDGTVHRL